MQTKKRKFGKNQAVLTAIILVLALSVAAVCVSAGNSPSGFNTAEAAAVIKKGSSGNDVKTVQTKLKGWGYYTGVVDGIFGSQTEAAVKYFQRTNKLTADGVVGAKTAAAMGVRLSGSSPSGGASGQGGYSAADVNLLARCVNAEARGEPYLGQVAVAAVVLNRVRSSSFPNSISGVIYQQYAFSSVLDGQINLAPGESAQKAAKDAMNGWDPTNGCLYFYNAAKTSNAWMKARPVKLEIGSHKFCL
ncbi:MAG: spore cortex-lytic enzyme [Clostridiales bacterium]|jgi:N-acetylmuramoyl-L-alanine amidase|nr:spore cortex-lytic enzyme [Clostridiales bacterium]